MSAYLIQNTDLSNQLVGVSTDGSAVWILDICGNIRELSATTGQPINVFQPTPGQYVFPSSIFSDGSYVWTCDAGVASIGAVYQYDTSGTLLRDISASTIVNNPSSIFSNGTYAWIGNYSTIDGSFCVSQIDASSGALVRSISGDIYNFSRISRITSDGTNIFAVQYYSNNITQFSASDASFIRTINIPGPADIVSDGSHAWAASRDDGTIVTFSLSDPTITTTISLDSFPFSLTIDTSSVWVHSANHDNTESYINQINIIQNTIDSSFSFNNPYAHFDYNPTISTPQNPHLGQPNNLVWAVEDTHLIEIGKTQTVPDPPIILTVVPGNSKLTVSFSPPINNGGTSITDYSYSIDGGTTKVSVDRTESLFIIPNLVNGTPYTITMYATNAKGTSVASISVQGTPVGPYVVKNTDLSNQLVSVSTDGSAVWILDISGNIRQFSATTGQPIDVFPPTRNQYLSPYSIFSDGSYVWTCDYGIYEDNTGAVYQYDTYGTFLRDISASTIVSNPSSIYSNGTHAWIGNYSRIDGSFCVSQIDASSGALVRSISGDNYHFYNGISRITSDGTNIFAVQYDNDLITQFLASDASCIKIINISSPTDIVSDGSHAWVASTDNETIVTFLLSDPNNYTHIPLDSYPHSLTIDTSSVWVHSVNSNFQGTESYINQINIVTNTIDISFSFNNPYPNFHYNPTITTPQNPHLGQPNNLVWAVEDTYLIEIGKTQTRPDPPINLTVVPGISQLTVTFSPPINDGGTLITDYLYRVNEGPRVSVGQTVSRFIIPNLVNGTPYTITMYATNAKGTSVASNLVQGTPVGPYVVKNTDLSNQLVSVSTDGSAVWILDISGNIRELSATTGQPINVFPPTPGQYVNPYSIFSDGSYVWTCDYGIYEDNTGAVYQYDTYGTLIRDISASTIVRNPQSIYSNGTYAWIGNYSKIDDNYCVSQIDASSGALVRSISGDNYHFSFGISRITSDGTNIFAVQIDTDHITQFLASDASCIRIINNIPGPADIVSDGSHAWVASTDNETIVTFLLSDPSITTTISLDSYPHSLTIDTSSVWVHSANHDRRESYINQINIVTNTIDISFSFNNLYPNIYYNPTITTPQNPHLGQPNNLVWAVEDTHLIEIGKTQTVPDPPIILTVVPGNSKLTVTFSPPINDGGTLITDYLYSIYGGIRNIDGGIRKVSVRQTVSPFIITGLNNGETYTITMYATNAKGTSVASNLVQGTPVGPYVVKNTDLSNQLVSVSTDGSAVWILDISGNIRELSATTGQPINVFPPTPGQYVNPYSIFSDGSYVWTCDYGIYEDNTGAVYQYNTSGNLLRTIIDQTIVSNPRSIYSNGTHAWIGNYSTIDGSFCVSQIDASSGALVRSISGDIYNFSHISRITSDGTNIFAVQHYSNNITQFLAYDATFIRTITSPIVQGVTDIVSDGSHAWVASTDDGTIVTFLLSDPSPINTTTISLDSFPYSLTIDTSSVWVHSANHDSTESYINQINIIQNTIDSSFSFNNKYPNIFYNPTITTPQNPHLGQPNNLVWAVEDTHLIEIGKTQTRPDPPIILTVVPGNSQLTVYFSPPINDGGTSITYYLYRVNKKLPVSVGQESQFNITGLNNGETYTITMYATNAIGTSFVSNSVQGTPGNAPCFKKNTKILTDNGYIPIQYLKKGQMVKTAHHGFVPIHAIGFKQIHHSPYMGRSPNALYRCSKQNFPELLEDLFITGYHAILVDDFYPGQREKTFALLGDIYITDDKYRLPACIDDRTILQEEEEFATIYHFALENTNYYENYGIYANGLLVETCSKRYLNEHSYMTIM